MDFDIKLTCAEEIPLTLLNELIEDIEREEEDDHIRENMISDVSWSLKSYVKDRSRFCRPNGGIVYVSHNDKIVAISCMEKNDSVLENAALIGVRMWVKKDYRGKFLHSLYLLPEQEKWARSLKAKNVFMTFNENSRKSLYRHIIKRDHTGSPYENRWDGYKLLGLIEFNFTPQYVIYKEL